MKLKCNTPSNAKQYVTGRDEISRGNSCFHFLAVIVVSVFCLCSTGLSQSLTHDLGVVEFLRTLKTNNDARAIHEVQSARDWDALILDPKVISAYQKSTYVSRDQDKYDAIVNEYQFGKSRITTKQTVGVWTAEIYLPSGVAVMDTSNLLQIFNIDSQTNAYTLERIEHSAEVLLNLVATNTEKLQSDQAKDEIARKDWKKYLRIAPAESCIFVWTLKKHGQSSSAVVSFSPKFNRVWFTD